MTNHIYPNYARSRVAPLTEFLSKCVCILTEIVGVLIATALICFTLKNAADTWSPTEMARICFSYPSLNAPPDSKDIASYLLSAAFFGSDALYFDSGEENTGAGEIPYADPSGSAGEALPQTPLDETDIEDIKDNFDIYKYDRTVLKDGEVALLPYDLSGNPSVGEVLLSNTTSYDPDVTNALLAPYPIVTDLSEYSDKEPLVLIVHTHGTESYSPEGAFSALPTDARRTSDISRNMIAVGAVMADLLNDSGIPTVHCEIMHDLESYNRAYDLAADTIQKYLSEYPSIKYVFDVHRDAIVRSNGDLVRPLTLLNGERAAQIMLLVGTNEKGADHPQWNTNFTFAVHLQNKLTTDYVKFARPINIRGASFNEQFTPGSLLIEIGSAANTLSEAKKAAEYLTYSIIDLIKENSVG